MIASWLTYKETIRPKIKYLDVFAYPKTLIKAFKNVGLLHKAPIPLLRSKRLCVHANFKLGNGKYLQKLKVRLYMGLR